MKESKEKKITLSEGTKIKEQKTQGNETELDLRDEVEKKRKESENREEIIFDCLPHREEGVEKRGKIVRQRRDMIRSEKRKIREKLGDDTIRNAMRRHEEAEKDGAELRRKTTVQNDQERQGQ